MKKPVSVAIETSCKTGGVALGAGHELVTAKHFDASSRHAVHLVAYLEQMLSAAGLKPADLDELYVSAGPGSFTGLRVGITVARTLAGAIDNLKCVAVPTPQAVVENVRDLDWQNLAVIMDAKESDVHVSVFGREADRIVPASEPEVLGVEAFLATAARPMMLIGEGLRHHEMAADGISLAAPPDDEIHFPSAEGVWRAGRAAAADGQFTELDDLLPIYSRKPEALRLWQKRRKG